MRSARYLAPFLASFAILLAACSGGQQPAGGSSGTPAGKATYGGTMTFSINADITDMDPLRSGLFVDRNLMYQMYDSLVRVNPKGDIIPWLAEKWTTSPDGKSYTFTLKQGVKFHDGSVFDAEAVKWNLDRYRLTKDSRRLAELAPVDSVTVVDPSTVRVDLKTPFVPFLSQLVDRSGMMLSRKVVEAQGDDFTRKAFKAGTGPYILTEAVKDDHYTFV